jgi:hypothetical protein
MINRLSVVVIYKFFENVSLFGILSNFINQDEYEVFRKPCLCVCVCVCVCEIK